VNPYIVEFHDCAMCGGSGKVRKKWYSLRSACPVCDGTGFRRVLALSPEFLRAQTKAVRFGIMRGQMESELRWLEYLERLQNVKPAAKPKLLN
jgi:hypothetical protein